MADHTLGTIRGTIKIDYDGAGVVKGIKDTEKAQDRLGTASDKVLGSFAKFGKGAAVLGGAISTVTSTSGLLVSTLSVLGPLTAAGFAAAPALVLGYASAMAVTKIAVAGVGEALKAAGGDAKKFEESIKNLSPEAQKFAQSFRASLPVLQGVQKSMQDAFFKGTAGQVGGVVQAVASLRPEATALSGTIGQVAQEFVKTVTSGKNISAIKGILSGVNAFLQQVKGSIGGVVTGFLDIARQGAAFGKTMGGSVAGALDRLSSWLSSIDVGAVFARAQPIVQALGQFLGDVAVIAQELFSIFIGDGQNVAGVLGTLASGMAAFLQSAQGQATLAALRDAMAAISGSVGQVFMALLQALAPVIVALAPGFATLAGQIAGVLVPAITAVSPLLTALATFLSQNMNILGPLAGVIGAAAAAYKVYSAGATAVAAIQAGLNSQLAVAAIAWIRSTAAIIANRVATLAAQAAMLVVRGAVIAWTAVQWALNAALSANPIGLVVIAIAALVAGLIYAYKNSETFRNIVQQVWSAIKTAISSVVDWITGTVWPAIQSAWNAIADGARSLWQNIVSIWNSIRNAISTAINAVKSVLTSVWAAIVALVRSRVNTMKAVIQAGFTAARAVVQSVLNAVKSVVSSVWKAIVSTVRNSINNVKTVIAGVRAIVATVRTAFNNAKTAAQTALNNLVSVVRGLPGRVTSALGNLAGLLRSKGQSLVQGFIDGIRSMIGKVSSAAKSVVSSVTNFLPGSPAKEGPLSGKGYVLRRAQRFMGDFAKGIKSKAKAPAKQASKAAEAAARALEAKRKALARKAAEELAERGRKAAEEARRRAEAKRKAAERAAQIRAAAQRAKEVAANLDARMSVNTNRLRAVGAQRYSSADLAAKQAVAAARAAAAAAKEESQVTNPRNPSTAPTPAPVVGGTRTYTIKIGSKTFTTLVVDAITGNPVAVAKAANEGNRKKTTTGSGRLATTPVLKKPRTIRRLS